MIFSGDGGIRPFSAVYEVYRRTVNVTIVLLFVIISFETEFSDFDILITISCQVHLLSVFHDSGLIIMSLT